jgi:hypothetical protein
MPSTLRGKSALSIFLSIGTFLGSLEYWRERTLTGSLGTNLLFKDRICGCGNGSYLRAASPSSKITNAKTIKASVLRTPKDLKPLTSLPPTPVTWNNRQCPKAGDYPNSPTSQARWAASPIFLLHPRRPRSAANPQVFRIIHQRPGPGAELLVVLRLNNANKEIKDYVLVPAPDGTKQYLTPSDVSARHNASSR